MMMFLRFMKHFNFVFTCVGLFAGLSARLHEKLPTDFHETWMEDGPRFKVDHVKFWCGSRNFSHFSLTLQEKAFSYIFINFSGIDASIMKKKIRCF